MTLLDTCVLFWLEQSPTEISPAVTAKLADPSALIFASAISAFELGLKVRRQLIQLPLPSGAWVTEVCRRRSIQLLPIDAAIAGAATELPRIHGDPCDRFLIATAQRNQLTLATPDDTIPRYPNLQTLW